MHMAKYTTLADPCTSQWLIPFAYLIDHTMSRLAQWHTTEYVAQRLRVHAHTQRSFWACTSQWEMVLQCNTISHWLGAYTEWSLLTHANINLVPNLNNNNSHMYLDENTNFKVLSVCEILTDPQDQNRQLILIGRVMISNDYLLIWCPTFKKYDWQTNNISSSNTVCKWVLIISLKQGPGIVNYIDGLVQDCRNSIAYALELLQSCTKPSILCVICVRSWGCSYHVTWLTHI